MLDDNYKRRLCELLHAARIDISVYESRLAYTHWKSRSVDFMALGLPMLYFALRVIFNRTGWHHWVEASWEFMAALLLTLTLFKLVFRWEEDAERYLKQLEANTRFANRAQSLLDRPTPVTHKEYELLFYEAGQLEKTDRKTLGYVTKYEEHCAQRKAPLFADLPDKVAGELQPFVGGDDRSLLALLRVHLSARAQHRYNDGSPKPFRGRLVSRLLDRFAIALTVRER